VSLVQTDVSVKKSSIFQKLFIELTAPSQSAVFSMRNSFRNFYDHYLNIINTTRENAVLQKKVESLENKIFDLYSVKKENERLKKLLKFGDEVSHKKVLAQVIGWDTSNEFRVLRINKGSDSGIKLKKTVITVNGLVGYTYRVSRNYTDILTILDQNNRVDVVVDRTRSHGILEGLSNFQCRMKYVVRTEPVKIGDILVTSGLGNLYPKGIKVGEISSIEKENYGLTQQIRINPTVNFHKLEEVVVLIKEDSSNASLSRTE
jgi:rod shape-determining protein MreC